MGEQYQDLLSENLALQTVPGYRQSFPVFSTDPASVTKGAPASLAGNPASVRMTRAYDFSQGPLQPSASPYHLAIDGSSFFEVKEADGSTSYTRNGAFDLSPQGKLLTSDGAEVLGKGGASVTIDTKDGGTVSIGPDGTIMVGSEIKGSIGLVHFADPGTSLHAGAYGRFSALKTDVKEGAAPNDQLFQGKLEQSNGNPVSQMANMIQAVRLYEANQKTIQAADTSQNQLITTLGSRPQA